MSATVSAHAERMDAVYALQRHVYDLTRKHYLLGRDRLIERLEPPVNGHVLEIGCGTARNLVHAARRYPSARFYGIDISTAMLRTARGKLAAADLQRECRVALADATHFSPQGLFGRSEFDRVFASYTLSMIPEWEAALDKACHLLAPRGSLHVVDFGGQEELPAWFGKLLGRWLAKFHVTPRSDLFEVSHALAAEHGLTCTVERLSRDYARGVVLSR
jgi:S-adenosylmethionine-diacylgycerolhomoserine-N-methlytransferase